MATITFVALKPAPRKLSRDCPECGWRTYPVAVAIGGASSRTSWEEPETCGRCGASLGRLASVAAATTAAPGVTSLG